MKQYMASLLAGKNFEKYTFYFTSVSELNAQQSCMSKVLKEDNAIVIAKYSKGLSLMTLTNPYYTTRISTFSITICHMIILMAIYYG